MKNFLTKFVCFTLAVMVFFIIEFGLTSMRKIALPLEIKYPEGYECVSNIPSSATLVIKGKEDIVYMIDATQIKVSADFSFVDREGTHRVPVEYNLDEISDLLDLQKVSVYAEPGKIKLNFVKKDSL